jgi:hypothetical protein
MVYDGTNIEKRADMERRKMFKTSEEHERGETVI